MGGEMMATKEESLQFVTQVAQQNIATRDEVLDAYDAGLGEAATTASKKMSVSEVLYFVGALIVSIGVYFLVYNNETLDTMIKIIFTLFFGLLNFGIGVFLNSKKNLVSVSFAFFLISAFLIPFGLNIAFENAGSDVGLASTQTIISGITFVFFLAAQLIMKKNIFIFFSVVFGTWLFIAATDAIIMGPIDWHFYAYRVLVVGLSYVFLGKFLTRDNQTAPLSGFLYAFGVLGFLGAAMTLGGWSPTQNIFWELIFPILVFGTLYLSVSMRVKSFLVFGTLFLMGYIGKITAEYFAEGLGWPIALMICGILVIGAGYLFVYIRKRYSLA